MIPVLHLVAGDVETRSLVLRNVVGEEVAPGIMGVIFNIDGRAGGDFGVSVDGANVMGLAKIIPCYDPVVLC